LRNICFHRHHNENSLTVSTVRTFHTFFYLEQRLTTFLTIETVTCYISNKISFEPLLFVLFFLKRLSKIFKTDLFYKSCKCFHKAAESLERGWTRCCGARWAAVWRQTIALQMCDRTRKQETKMGNKQNIRHAVEQWIWWKRPNVEPDFGSAKLIFNLSNCDASKHAEIWRYTPKVWKTARREGSRTLWRVHPIHRVNIGSSPQSTTTFPLTRWMQNKNAAFASCCR